MKSPAFMVLVFLHASFAEAGFVARTFSTAMLIAPDVVTFLGRFDSALIDIKFLTFERINNSDQIIDL